MPNLFPDIQPTRWDIEPEAFQVRDTSVAGVVQINSYDPVVQLYPRGEWEILSRAEFDLIEDHWYSYRTSAFSLFDFKLRKMRGLYVAVADGVATIYTLPAKGVVTPTIKHNGVAAGTQPTLLVGTGAEGEDQIQYTAPTKPGAGVIITLDAADAREKLELYYVNVRFPGRDVEADIDSVILDFIQKVA